MIETYGPGRAYRLLRESQLPSDRPDVAKALAGATRFRRGKGSTFGLRMSETTAVEIACYLEEIADLDADLTAEESAGGRGEASAARIAAQRIRAALNVDVREQIAAMRGDDYGPD